MLTQSYDHGSLSNEKLLSKTIGNLLDEATERFPDKEAVIFHNDKRRKTYSQLNQKVLNNLNTTLFHYAFILLQ